jgi:hypothetical protein
VAGCCECGDEPSGSGATDLVNMVYTACRTQIALFLYPCCFLSCHIICESLKEVIDGMDYLSNFESRAEHENRYAD